jgi:methyl-accepting chemotaxis protein
MEYSKKFKGRIMILLFASSLAVALVFGLSFFSLVSTESALANSVPELEELAEKFKSTLTLNTLAFAGIIIGSFIALASLVTDRLFKPLDGIEKGLDALASGKLPSAPEESGSGPFDALWRSFISARSHIEEREHTEISILEDCVAKLGEGIDVTDRLVKLIEAKIKYSGKKETPEEHGSGDSSDDPIFMQPV